MLYTLPKLQNVDLGGNDYAGAIPSEFGTMPALKTLVLKDNQYTGTIPDTILSNTQIEVLNLMGNQLTGGFPAAVAGMSSLKYLNLSENAIGGTIPNLSALTNLISLSAWQCGLTGTIPETLYTLSGLQILDLSETSWKAKSLPVLLIWQACNILRWTRTLCAVSYRTAFTAYRVVGDSFGKHLSARFCSCYAQSTA